MPHWEMVKNGAKFASNARAGAHLQIGAEGFRSQGGTASSEKLSEDAMEQLRFLLNEEEAYTRRRKQGEPVTSIAALKWHKKH